ncbi:hypothetical protein D3C75_332130 [compost metagenome]
MSAIGKIFIDNKKNPFSQGNLYREDDAIIIFYDYNKLNSYLDVLNTANEHGLTQIILTPNKFVKLINKLEPLNLKAKKIEFDPPLQEEDQEFANKVLRENKNNGESLQESVDFYNKEYNSIPKNLTFFSQNGNSYSLYNNGVISIEEKEEIHELNPFLRLLIGKQA